MVVSQFLQRLIAVISLLRNMTLSIGLYDTLSDISIEAPVRLMARLGSLPACYDRIMK